jgi:hypothetical protein
MSGFATAALFVRCYPRDTQEMVFDAHDLRISLMVSGDFTRW